MTNKGLYTNVSIQKTGYVEVMPGQQIRYDFSGIGNNSTTSLTSFYWRDTIPTQAVRLDKLVTGTYNVTGNYKVVYKTNLSGDTWRAWRITSPLSKTMYWTHLPPRWGWLQRVCDAVYGLLRGGPR